MIRRACATLSCAWVIRTCINEMDVLLERTGVTHSLTHSLTHSFIHFHAYSQVIKCTDLLIHSFSISFTHSLTRSLIDSLIHNRNRSDRVRDRSKVIRDPHKRRKGSVRHLQEQRGRLHQSGTTPRFSSPNPASPVHLHSLTTTGPSSFCSLC